MEQLRKDKIKIEGVLKRTNLKQETRLKNEIRINEIDQKINQIRIDDFIREKNEKLFVELEMFANNRSDRMDKRSKLFTELKMFANKRSDRMDEITRLEKNRNIMLNKIKEDILQLKNNEESKVIVKLNQENLNDDEILSYVINIISRYFVGKKLTITVPFESVDGKTDEIRYVLNDNFLNRLKNIFNRITSYLVPGSDEETIDIIQKATSMKIEIFKSTHEKERKSGAFFKYLNKTIFDFSRYGIYKSFDVKNYDDNCLYLALKLGGLSEIKLNQLKCKVIDRKVPQNKLKEICESLKISIKVYNGTSNPVIYGKEFDEKYVLGLLDEHYFNH